MKGTIYGTRQPSGTQVRKRLGTTGVTHKCTPFNGQLRVFGRGGGDSDQGKERLLLGFTGIKYD
jgi:hypothetical protein